MTKDGLIDKIIGLEWEMFTNVTNAGGKAACQYDSMTFRIMRASQYKTWSDALLHSWLDDLQIAIKEKRNLCSEKYARMMKSTFPEEYEAIADRLPPINKELLKKIDEIVETHLRWKEALDAEYPYLSNRGRPLRRDEDIKYSTPSLETYMRSELLSFSPRTIEIYYNETAEREKEGRNEAEENLLNQVQSYGVSDLREANGYFSSIHY